MSPTVRRLVPVGGTTLALLFAACAVGTQTGGGPGTTSQDLITRAELASSVTGNVRDAIETLRPQWLRITQPTSLRPPYGTLPQVCVDNVLHRELDMLAHLSLDDVEEIRLVGASEATTRWGTGVTGGVIWVITRR